jgi:hypothetical protein
MLLKFAVIREDINTKERELLFATADQQECLDFYNRLLKKKLNRADASKGLIKAGTRYRIVEIV